METRNITEEGCPGGQVSNEVGTECIEPEQIHPSKEELAEAQEKAQRKQAKEQVRHFEEGEPGALLKVECQMAKAYLDRGQEYVDEITDESLTR